jgi:glycosyltransferase involved in cell wall biosynthesis
MRIATIAYLHGAGGAERQILMLSNFLAKIGHEVHLVILNEKNTRYIISDKVNQHDLSQKEHGKFRILQRWIALRNELKQIRPDVTINYNFQSVYFEAIMPKKICGKIVYSERGDPYDKEYSGILGLLRTLSFKRTDGFVFQSEGARDYFNEEIRKRSVVIHNPVSVPIEKYPIPAYREKKIVTVGRLHPQKNQKLLIEAFSAIHKTLPEYNLEVYGDGKLRDELNTLIEEKGLKEYAHIYPSRKDIWDCIYKASLFVLTSDYEGMPNVLMEAMALGVPCISTDCRPGGARTLIEDGVNGRIVPLRNINALISCMKDVLLNPGHAAMMGNDARNIAVTHTEQKIYNKWEHYLKTLIGIEP